MLRSVVNEKPARLQFCALHALQIERTARKTVRRWESCSFSPAPAASEAISNSCRASSLPTQIGECQPAPSIWVVNFGFDTTRTQRPRNSRRYEVPAWLLVTSYQV